MNPLSVKNNKKSLLVFVVVLAIAGLWLYKKVFVSPQVALISSNPQLTCTSNVDVFIATDSCGAGMVKRVDYTCVQSDQQGYEGGGPKDCLDPYLVYQHAQTFCGETCSIVPTATPSALPSPSPTPIRTYIPYPSSYPTSIPSPSAYPTSIPTSTPTPSPLTPIISCSKQLGSWTYLNPCKGRDLYQNLDFYCQGETQSRTIGAANSCSTSTSLVAEAKKVCLNINCVSPTPTPQPTVRPKPITTTRCYKIFGRNYCFPVRR